MAPYRAPYRIEFSDVAAALPDFLLAGTFALAWVRPDAPGVPPVKRLVLIVLLDFFIIHSAGFMAAVAFGNRRRRTTVLLVGALGAFYTLLLAAFSHSFGDWWLLTSFWGLLGNRLLGVVLGQAPDDKRQFFIMGTWAFTVAAYLLSVAVGAGADLPRYGITDAVVRAQGFTTGGLWTDTPHTALATGTIYFALVGCTSCSCRRSCTDTSGQSTDFRPTSVHAAQVGAPRLRNAIRTSRYARACAACRAERMLGKCAKRTRMFAY